MANLHTNYLIILCSCLCISDYTCIMNMIEISITGVEFLLHKKVYTNILNKSIESRFFFPKHNKNSEASYLTLTAHLPSSKKHYKNTEN